MRILKLIALIAVLYSCTRSDERYEITGEIMGLKSSPVYLLIYAGEGQAEPIDSTELKDGNFFFSGKLASPALVYIMFENASGYIRFFAENSRITISADSANLGKRTIQGSDTEDQYQFFFKEYNRLFKSKLDSLNKEYDQAKLGMDTASLGKIKVRMDEVSGKEKEYLMDFISTYHGSVISPYLVVKFLMYRINYEELKPICDQFDPAIDSNWAVKYLKNWVERLKKSAIGREAPDFTMKDTAGVPHSLSSLRGRYVLLDFWNTGCGPCRATHPRLRKIYDTYRDRGFEIFAVSFDKTREIWIHSIKQDKINWLQVSALTGWKNEARDLYCVEKNPMNFLIDPYGVIIARDLEAAELSQKLAELLD